MLLYKQSALIALFSSLTATLAAPAATNTNVAAIVTKTAAAAVAAVTDGVGDTCPSYIVIEAPGLGDKGGYWTGPTTYGILNGLKGGERYTLQTDPPADSGPNTSGATLVSQAAQGSLEIVRVVAERTAECPNVKFVIFGYSYGSIELALALNNPALLRTNIAAVLYYGNCFWHADREENRGTATSGSSVCGGLGIGTPPLYESITADFCLVNDYLCTGTPYTTNKSKNTHWNYRNSQWQNQAVAFAINRLKSGDNLNL